MHGFTKNSWKLHWIGTICYMKYYFDKNYFRLSWKIYCVGNVLFRWFSIIKTNLKQHYYDSWIIWFWLDFYWNNLFEKCPRSVFVIFPSQFGDFELYFIDWVRRDKSFCIWPQKYRVGIQISFFNRKDFKYKNEKSIKCNYQMWLGGIFNPLSFLWKQYNGFF